MLRIRTFGGCRVERDGTPLDELSGQRKSLAALALLAGASPHGLTRESLAALLWPDSDDVRARTSLKQLVHSLRRQLGVVDLFLPAGDLRLNPEWVTSDVREFRDAASRGEHEAAVQLYAGSFLEGFYVRGADGFERWASVQRAALARDFARSLEALAEAASRSADTRGAVDAWRRLAIAEPLNARAAKGLMHALDAVGERAEALQQARTFHCSVREEIGGEPDPSVERLADAIRRAPSSIPAVSSAARVDRAPLTATESPRISLAILPFANTSGDAEDEHFSDGLTDELIGVIGKIAGLTVTGRTSSFAFKGKALDVRAIADSLHVSSVLEGSVRRSGDRFKIGVQLVRATDGAVVWSEAYDRGAQEIFVVQAEIAAAIAGALCVRLGPAMRSRAGLATRDLVAYEHYLKGRYFQNRVSEDDLRRAVGYFEHAIARDPEYAQAYAGLADARLLLTILGDRATADAVASVRTAVERALALDDTIAEAHTSLASVLFGFDWNWDAAARAFGKAIALDPGYGRAHQRYGLFLMYQGRLGEAQVVLERARSLDPLAASAHMNLGRVHLGAHRPDVAIPLLLAAVELSPRLALAQEQLGYAYLQLGQQEHALKAFRQAATSSGVRGFARLAYALAATGHDQEARTIVNDILRSAPSDLLPSFALAIAYAGLGEANAVFEWLERAYVQRDAFLHSIKATAAFDGLHADTRWAALLWRMGLSN